MFDNTEHLSDLKNIQTTLEALNAQVSRMNQAEGNGGQNHIKKKTREDESTSVPQPQAEAAARAFGIQLSNETFSFPTRVEEEIFCPNCKTRQKGNRDKCWECSAKFVYEDE